MLNIQSQNGIEINKALTIFVGDRRRGFAARCMSGFVAVGPRIFGALNLTKETRK
jgi:hypothetical protein